MFKHIKDNKGFSLIELLVVVAIIGILAAIAVPSYQGFQKRARIGVAKSALSNIYTLIRVAEAETRTLDLDSHNLNLPDGYSALGILKTGSNGVSPIDDNKVLGASAVAELTNCTYTDSGHTTGWKAGANALTNDEDVEINHKKIFNVGGSGSCTGADTSSTNKSDCEDSTKGGGAGTWTAAGSCPVKSS